MSKQKDTEKVPYVGECSFRPTHPSPSVKNSFFQIGTSRFNVSRTYRQLSKASDRCAEETAIAMLASPTSRRPVRCTMEIFWTLHRDLTSAAIRFISLIAMGPYASYSSLKTVLPSEWSRVVPTNNAVPPAAVS